MTPHVAPKLWSTTCSNLWRGRIHVRHGVRVCDWLLEYKDGTKGQGVWVPTQIRCQPFAPNVWHHIVSQVHHYDSLTLDGVQHSLNLAEPSGPLPLGWTDNLGVQWQLDTASSPLAFSEWIDNVKLTIR